MIATVRPTVYAAGFRFSVKVTLLNASASTRTDSFDAASLSRSTRLSWLMGDQSYVGSQPTRIGERPLRVMTARAGDRAVARQAAAEEEPPPERDFLRRQRIAFRDRHVGVETQRDAPLLRRVSDGQRDDGA